VWKLDRLGRSVKDVLIIADDLYERGIALRVLTGTLAGAYTPTGEGKFFFTIMAALTRRRHSASRPRREPRPDRQGARGVPGDALPAHRRRHSTRAELSASPGSHWRCLCTGWTIYPQLT